jgi:hypothetical protein
MTLFHDIVFRDVMKCTYLREPAPPATLSEHGKNTFNVAKCGSLREGFRTTLCMVACLPDARSEANVGQMWGSSPLPYFIVHRSLPAPHHKKFKCGGMWGCVRVSARRRTDARVSVIRAAVLVSVVTLSSAPSYDTNPCLVRILLVEEPCSC